MRALVQLYTSVLKKHQITTNMFTTGTVFLLGDLISQQLIEERGKEHQVERTVRSVAVGTVYIAPFVTFIYNFADKLFGPSLALKAALRKMAVIAMFSPLTSAGYIAVNNLFQGKPVSETLQKWRYDLPAIVLNGYKVWLPTHFFLLTVVPLRHRMFISNFVGVLWTGYLTYAANKAISPENLDKQATQDEGY